MMAMHRAHASAISGREVMSMNVNDTLRGMELCALAYKEVQPQFPGMTLEVIDDENGVQCYLRRQGDTLFITFRGSNSAKDWKVDLTFSKPVSLMISATPKSGYIPGS